ncbi:amidohydrolase [Bacillus canaveralius]|uniref:Amidohydrolase n=1 Tax=Bacillus canaveralius TaxID=1403243 RepID=A0A2N5GN76_9BACI|nr:amidohydrolase [Bacillus canaveralius]PLR83715.1 amidohydrolase [Bacillus canaveralius]PLR95183.1 amidohydrolase [Bacillus canaveralius]
MGTLWHGGLIYTMETEGEQVEAIYTENGTVMATGTFAGLQGKYQNEISEINHLHGKTMLPGFVDSHMHLIGHGETLIRLDLSRHTSKQAVFKAVEEYADRTAPGKWIIGEGWNENLWENPEVISREEMDALVPDHPVLLKRVCRHALVANSLAFKAANITSATICPPGGVIDKSDSGKLTGLLKDQAQDLLLSALPDVEEEYLQQALRAAIKNAWRLGLTGAHTEDLNYYGGFQKTYETFKHVIEDEGLRFRAHLLVHHEVASDLYKEGGTFLGGNQWIEFGAIKIFADGALGGRTALLSHPYADEPGTSGVAIFTEQQLLDLVKNAREHEMPVAIHTIGDLAFEYALNALEKSSLQGKGRDRLIHAQILRSDLIERAKKLPLILDIQPMFTASDFPWVVERIGEEHMKYCYAWKTLLDAGIPCAGGSDAPIEPADPLLGIHAAVTRSNVDDPAKIAYKPEEALSVYEAVSLFTKGSAYAICHEHDRGRIKAGYAADFTVLSENIFEIDPQQIADIQVAMTVVDGQIVYKLENPGV